MIFGELPSKTSQPEAMGANRTIGEKIRQAERKFIKSRKLARTIMTSVKRMIRYFCIILAICGFLYICFYIFAMLGLLHSNL